MHQSIIHHVLLFVMQYASMDLLKIMLWVTEELRTKCPCKSINHASHAVSCTPPEHMQVQMRPPSAKLCGINSS